VRRKNEAAGAIVSVTVVAAAVMIALLASVGCIICKRFSMSAQNDCGCDWDDNLEFMPDRLGSLISKDGEEEL